MGIQRMCYMALWRAVAQEREEVATSDCQRCFQGMLEGQEG